MRDEQAAPNRTPNVGLWVLCALTAFIAVGAAYSSYEHGVAFALRYGGDAGTAAIWPLIVDGMLTSGTVVLWMTRHIGKWRGRWAAWLTFGVGIALSLSANITAAPHLSVFAIMVTGCPPIALLLLIELLNPVLTHHHAETTSATDNESGSRAADENPVPQNQLSVVSDDSRPSPEPTVEHKMWLYWIAEQAEGRRPTGSELDRVVSTNNYGRGVLRKWRDEGRIGLVAPTGIHEVRRPATNPTPVIHAPADQRQALTPDLPASDSPSWRD